jgi:hypothetical protein
MMRREGTHLSSRLGMNVPFSRVVTICCYLTNLLNFLYLALAFMEHVASMRNQFTTTSPLRRHRTGRGHALNRPSKKRVAQGNIEIMLLGPLREMAASHVVVKSLLKYCLIY